MVKSLTDTGVLNVYITYFITLDISLHDETVICTICYIVSISYAITVFYSV